MFFLLVLSWRTNERWLIALWVPKAMRSSEWNNANKFAAAKRLTLCTPVTKISNASMIKFRCGIAFCVWMRSRWIQSNRELSRLWCRLCGLRHSASHHRHSADTIALSLSLSFSLSLFLSLSLWFIADAEFIIKSALNEFCFCLLFHFISLLFKNCCCCCVAVDVFVFHSSMFPFKLTV